MVFVGKRGVWKRSVMIVVVAIGVMVLSGCTAMKKNGAINQYEGLEQFPFQVRVYRTEDSGYVRDVKKNLVSKQIVNESDRIVFVQVPASAFGHGLNWVLVAPGNQVLEKGDVVVISQPGLNNGVDDFLKINNKDQMAIFVKFICKGADEDCLVKNRGFGAISPNGITTGKSVFF